MTNKLSIIRQDGLPCPCIYLATAQMLADWYRRQLLDALDRGDTCLLLSCFDSLSGCSAGDGAYAVLRMAADFLRDHPQVENLTLACAGARCHEAYQRQWNMLLAETGSSPART